MMEGSTLIQFNLYCDLAIEKLKKIKIDYPSAVDTNSLTKMKQVTKEIRDAKYLFYELQSIANEKKNDLRNLIEIDLT